MLPYLRSVYLQFEILLIPFRVAQTCDKDKEESTPCKKPATQVRSSLINSSGGVSEQKKTANSTQNKTEPTVRQMPMAEETTYANKVRGQLSSGAQASTGGPNYSTRQAKNVDRKSVG